MKSPLPEPFAWINIPGGNVRLGGNEASNGGYITDVTYFDVGDFTIAKYPVTNAQFSKFMEANGYNQKEWWNDVGWEAKEQGKWIEPAFWKKAKWNKPDYPVTGISWYEATAFCRWLNEVTGENIQLPTEQQWQRAAQALPDGQDSGYLYPWGDDWNADYCQNSVSQRSESTSPVTCYEGKGNSLCGVVDMVGNVWEWCSNEYSGGTDMQTDSIQYVLRGGSWNFRSPNSFRVDFREKFFATGRGYHSGFRLSSF